ncbi:MAG: CoB--CoM heterodisulfide reductase iron-sulfur subunit B family protein [Candidatus Freyarchaeota archaeon]
MNDYSLFLGCLIPFRLPFIEASSRMVLEALGIQYEPLEGASCCPDPIGVQGVSFKAWLYLAARNLALAEEEGKDILTLCSGCFETLKTAREILLRDPALMEEVNEALKRIDREFRGDIDVLHIVEALYRVGPRRIESLIVNPLEVNVAVHYGCHLLRPSEVLGFDDPENPRKLDVLVEALGPKSLNYNYKDLCCGAAMNNIDRAKSYPYIKLKLESATKAGADCMVVACPFCFMQYDFGQLELKRKGYGFALPVFYYTEMLGLALGFTYKELGLAFHRTSVRPFLEEKLF